MASNDMQIVQLVKNVEAQYVEMMVPLYSYGCEKKIKKALASLKGIYSVNVDFHLQKVTVWGICDKCDVLTVVKNKRKGARFWNSEEDDDKTLFQESHSAPQSPQFSSPSTKSYARYFAMIKRQSLKLDLSVMKRTSSINWKSVKKAFVRSNSF